MSVIATKIDIHTDGGALDNPGPAAIGIVITINGHTKTYAESIGERTNNEAEYQAVVFALKKAKQLVGKKIKTAKLTLHLDSELVGKQLRGEYKIKDHELAHLFVEVWNLRHDLPPLHVEIIPRERNQRADALVKSILYKKELF